MPTNRLAQMPRVLVEDLPTKSSQTVTCPRCPATLRFGTDALGYTVERCDGCRYSRRLVAVVATAELRQRIEHPGVELQPRGALKERVLALVPTAREAALSSSELADLAGLERHRITSTLSDLKKDGLVYTAPATQQKRRGRPIAWLYWRAA